MLRYEEPAQEWHRRQGALAQAADLPTQPSQCGDSWPRRLLHSSVGGLAYSDPNDLQANWGTQ